MYIYIYVYKPHMRFITERGARTRARYTGTMQLGELKSPVPALLLGAILGCVVTSVIHSLTISCVQCGSAASRNLVGFDKFSSLTSNNHFRVRQLGLVASDSSCATLRLQLETVKSATSSSASTSSYKSEYKRRRRSDG